MKNNDSYKGIFFIYCGFFGMFIYIHIHVQQGGIIRKPQHSFTIAVSGQHLHVAHTSGGVVEV